MIASVYPFCIFLFYSFSDETLLVVLGQRGCGLFKAAGWSAAWREEGWTLCKEMTLRESSVGQPSLLLEGNTSRLSGWVGQDKGRRGKQRNKLTTDMNVFSLYKTPQCLIIYSRCVITTNIVPFVYCSNKNTRYLWNRSRMKCHNQTNWSNVGGQVFSLCFL